MSTRFAVIGAGRFAEECHIPGIQAHGAAEVAVLCSRGVEKARAVAKRFGVAEVMTDYEALLRRTDIDGVTIATPDASHFALARAALLAGKPVFCEKPLTMTLAEADELVGVAERTGLVTMVAFTFRYARALHLLRQMVRAGEIGRPLHVAMQAYWGHVGQPGQPLAWRDQADQSAAGIWGDAGSHLFDALAYAVAPVQDVCAQMMIARRAEGVSQPDSIDLGVCLGRLSLDHAGPTTGYVDRDPATVFVTMTASRVGSAGGMGDDMVVSGTTGVLAISLSRGQTERARLLRPGGAWQDVSLPPDANTGQPLALTRMMGAFVEAVRRGATDPAQDPTFAAGLHAQRALAAGLRSAQTNQWVTV